MNGTAVWLVAGLLLGVQELILPGYFLLWIGLAACGTGLLAFGVGFGWYGQLATFAALAMALIALAALRRQPIPDLVNASNAGLIGTTCFALGFQAGEGRVRLRDGTWNARTTDAEDPLLDQPLRILALDGTTLLVTILANTPRDL